MARDRNPLQVLTIVFIGLVFLAVWMMKSSSDVVTVGTNSLSACPELPANAPMKQQTSSEGTSPIAPCATSAQDLHVTGIATADRFTGMVEGGALRRYGTGCGRDYTLPDLYPVFAAHAVEWSIMGRTEAWWSVLTSWPRTATVSPALKEKFYASGVTDVDEVLTELEGLGRPRSSWKTRTVMDFGCGLGRIGFALAAHFQEVTCVDQSTYHLRTAAAEWTTRQKVSDAKVNLVVSSPDLLAAIGGKTFDFIHTQLVMQHMVSPLQTVYMAQFCDLLKPGGTTYIHIPTRTPRDSCDMEKSVKRGGMQMHGTPAADLQRIIEARGCKVRVDERGKLRIGNLKNGTAAIVWMTKAEK